MSYANEKFRQMVELLFDATVAGSLDWQIGEGNNPYINLGDNMVLIRLGQNINGEDLYIYDIYNQDGKLSERFDDEQLNGAREPKIQLQNWFTLSRSIFELANRKAKNSDIVVDSILDELNRKIFPF